MKIIDTKIKLNNGNFIPQIGLGTYKLTDETQTFNAVLNALKNGYRHIDTATIYNNHKIIGAAIKDSKISRKEIFITSKIWNTAHSFNDTLKELNQILTDLQIDYLDLVLVHWPTEKRLECYKALEQAVERGIVKSIGVSNFQVHHLEELLENCKIKPVINQIELHPALLNQKVVEFCKENDIVIESWGTLIRGKCVEIQEIKQLAKKYNKSEAQFCLKWAIQKGYVIIPKSAHVERIISNIDLDDFELSDKDILMIESINQERTGPDPDNFDF